MGNVLLGHERTKMTRCLLTVMGLRGYTVPSRDTATSCSLQSRKAVTPKTVFADMIKLRILRWGDNVGLSGWTLNVITGVLIRRRHRDFTQKRRRREGDHVTTETDSHDTVTNQSMAAARSLRTENALPSSASRGRTALATPGPQNPERINLLFSAKQPWETNIVTKDLSKPLVTRESARGESRKLRFPSYLRQSLHPLRDKAGGERTPINVEQTE